MTGRLRARLVLFVVITALVNAGPIYRHVLGGTAPTLDWDMFSAKGLDRCAIRYFRVEGATLAEFDGLSVMGFERRADAPISWRQPADPDEARTLARRACAAVGPRADVRIDLRCGTPSGWVSRVETTEPVCPRTRR